MPTVGRNDPCPCGSGKKYKQCHGPIDAERATAQRKLRQAPDTLLPKLFDALDRFSLELPSAMQRFWNGAYQMQDIKELDEHEDRGSERFLTWFAFDSPAPDGQTPVQRFIADPEGLELTDSEAQVLSSWADVRLQPYAVVGVRKGHGLTLRPLFGEGEIELEDHKAAKRVTPDEVLIAHLIPAGDTYYVAGAAAHLTPDTVDKLREFSALHLADLQREQPAAGLADLVRSRSYVFNHFVMALPREEKEAGRLDELVAMTRATLNVTAAQIGLGGQNVDHVDVDAFASDSDEYDEDEAVAADLDDNAGYGVPDTTQTLESGSISVNREAARHSTDRAYEGGDD